ncbi:hypothetical protein AJ85_18970 [Alkalihalobacillus alcalophilus ATCC 27647 = CGMCC 1.3604]|uniref:Uncharacterized protein n=1 Tax=Alkalihalobacillus alcalophilus ATCC 27647 = CGMCC 1.3604 TaxID=1218173 RepID=A0A4S4JVI8_ALKAL|nr:hypothetical protein AJ85_18970 [Alkalihalobacillus alcalophilus ATCC 27647 = CGMCC 1.3604]
MHIFQTRPFWKYIGVLMKKKYILIEDKHSERDC